MSYKYEITAGKYGGEYTIGTIPNSVGLHWLNRKEDDFQDYLFSWDRESDFPKIPKKFELPEWHEIDNIMHECTVEFHDINWFNVYDLNTHEYSTIKFSEINKDEVWVDDSEMNKALSTKKTAVFAHSWEKGNYVCECNEGEFIIDEPFDIKKVRNVLTTQWDTTVLLNAFQYEDYTFNVYGGDSIGTGSSAWLHFNFPLEGRIKVAGTSKVYTLTA